MTRELRKTSAIDYFRQKIVDKKKSNTYRKLRIFKRLSATKILEGKKILTCFASNDYLGLSHNPKIKKAAIDAIQKYGFGSSSSRFICGNHPLYKKLEKSLAELKNSEDALVFSSGFTCSIGVINALAGKNDLIIADHLAHACLIDGSLASNAKFYRFKHNNLQHCRDLLIEHRQKFRNCLLISETVFSMDGDLGLIQELLSLAREFDCILLTDDAHGIMSNHFDDNRAGIKTRSKAGSLNKNSSHLTSAKKDWRWLQIGTLSKSFGSLGGYVCGNRELIDFLKNFARSVIYSTSLPPACVAAAIEAVKLTKNQELGKKALENARYFCKIMDIADAKSTIVPIIIGDSKRTLKIANLAKKSGFLIAAIRSPTVASGSERLRISFCALHRKSEIRNLAKFLLKHL